MDNYVKIREYMKEMTTAFMEIKHMKDSIERIDKNLNDVKKKLFEGNGDKPIATMVKEHDNILYDHEHRIKKVEMQPLRNKAKIFDTVFKYVSRGVAILILIGILSLIIDDPEKVHQIIKIFLH